MQLVVRIVVTERFGGKADARNPAEIEVPPAGFEPAISTLKG